MSEAPLLLQREPPLATLVVNRPEARNALDEAMQIGLIHRLLPPDQIEPFTYETACKMATHAPLSLMQSKASVQLCLDTLSCAASPNQRRSPRRCTIPQTSTPVSRRFSASNHCRRFTGASHRRGVCACRMRPYSMRKEHGSVM